jgi:hypothetical protein
MKKIVVLCFVFALQGLNAFGQTNAVPSTSQSVPRPQLPAQKAAAKPKVDVVPSRRVLSHEGEIPASELATFRRIERDGLLTPSRPNYNSGAALESIFRSDNDHMGDTCIRDTFVTIFPTGR